MKIISSCAFALLFLSVVILTVGIAREAAITASPAVISFGGGNTIGAPGNPVRALASGDLDNDGDPDVVSAVYAADNIDVWENDGSPFSGVWISGTVGNPGAPTYALAIGDLDNDGNLDIASGSHAAAGFEIVVWRNDGTPFVGTWASNGVVPMGLDRSVYALAMADLDNNGDLDLVSGNSAAQVIAWQNSGVPFAGPWSSNDVGATGGGQIRALAVGDLDNDGNLDVVSGDIAHQVVAWQNDGAPFSGGWISQTVFTAGDGVSSVQLIDLDSDGDLDVAAGCGPSEDYEITTWENDGTPFIGTWVQHDVSAPEVGVYVIAAADLDVDGDLDLASGSQAHATYAEVRTWENNGSPFSGLWGGIDVGGNDVDVTALTFADLNRDGDPDVVAATSVITAWPNTRTPAILGSWTEVARPALAEDTLSVALTDFEYDGKLDVATGTGGHGVQIWRGNGGYAWTYVTADSLPSTGYWTDLAWGQIDNSKYRDLAAASDGDGLRAWLVTQVSPDWANLDAITQGLPSTGGYKALDLGDVDNDGLLDLVACGKSLGVRSWQGTGGSGSPHWHARTMLSGTLDFCDVALAHVNHDGDVDLVAASCEGSNAGIPVWRGYGDFSFTPAPPVTATGSYNAVALGDLDNDGDTDVVAARAKFGGVRVWLGDGGATWTDIGAISPSLDVLSLDLADFNNDGYLDVLAGLRNGGVRVWKGKGGASWTDASTNLATTMTYEGVAFGRVDGDANLDVVGAESGSSGARVWTAVEPPPGGWMDFQPYTSPPYVWERSRQVTCTVRVGDAGSGLDVSTGEYCFTRDGGATCVGGWRTATVSGSDGTTAPQVMTATNVPFDQDSETQNTIQFHVRDMGGFTGTSPLYRVAIDATPPTNPAVVNSTSHTPGVWSDSTNVVVTWTDGADATSGVWGYSYELTDSSSTLPDETIETTGNTGSDSAGTDGQNWYFHLRTVDRAGNGATPAVHVGPFWIDKTYPSNPSTLASSSHTPGVWSNDPTVDVWWTAASDGSGSGIAGYWYSWREFQQNDPLDDNTTGLSLSSDTLSTGDGWYFNLRTRDNVGRKATGALNLGPFYIDTTAPSAWVTAPGFEVNTNPFTVSWTGGDSDSGLASFDVQSSDNGTTWNDWRMGTTALSDSFTGGRGQTHYFRVRARDNAGNVSDWSTAHSVAVGVDVTVRVQDEGGTDKSGAKVYRNGDYLGDTGAGGTLIVEDTLLDDELAAIFLVETRASAKGNHSWGGTSDWSYRTYITSVDIPDVGNPQLHQVTNTYVEQVLTVREQNALIGFHPLVVVEWDASGTFLQEVRRGWEMGSDYLYDLTDGHFFFEALEIRDNADAWADADYRVHASNTVWPQANTNGIWHGSDWHVYLPRVFSRDASRHWDEDDGARAAIHEWGHYGLGLKDEYEDRNSSGDSTSYCSTDYSTEPSDATRSCFMHIEGNTTEMCSDLASDPHRWDTEQDAYNGESCWRTVVRGYDDTHLLPRWTFRTPVDRGQKVAGPTTLAVADWMDVRIVDNSTRVHRRTSSLTGLDFPWESAQNASYPFAAPGVCPPFGLRWSYGNTGAPAAQARVWVDRPGSDLRQGETDATGLIEILGAHDGGTVRARTDDGASGSYTVDCSLLATATLTQPQLAVLTADPFTLDVAVHPQGENAVQVRVASSVELPAAPTVALWQDGAGESVTVTMSYDSGLEAWAGTAALDTALGRRGQVETSATAEGHTLHYLTSFNIEQVVASELSEFYSDDGLFELTLRPGSLPGDTLISIVPGIEGSRQQDDLVRISASYEVIVASGAYSLSNTAVVDIRFNAIQAERVLSDTLQVYHWDHQAGRWVSDGGVVDHNQSWVTAYVDHLSTFAILGESAGQGTVYLPLIFRSYTP